MPGNEEHEKVITMHDGLWSDLLDVPSGVATVTGHNFSPMFDNSVLCSAVYIAAPEVSLALAGFWSSNSYYSRTLWK